jgi:nitroreductase
MDINEAILSRRSIRKYTGEDVSEEILKELLRAGMSAPSAHNEQPWHFIVIRDRGILEKVTKLHPYAAMLREAPVAIAVCADLKLADFEAWWIQDCSAAAENILLAAHGQGLGAVWLGVHPRDERARDIQALLGLPEDIKPLCLISIGHPAEKKTREDRYKPDRVHHDRW